MKNLILRLFKVSKISETRFHSHTFIYKNLIEWLFGQENDVLSYEQKMELKQVKNYTYSNFFNVDSTPKKLENSFEFFGWMLCRQGLSMLNNTKWYFFGEQTFKEKKSCIKTIEKFPCLVLVHSSCQFPTWTEKIEPDWYQIWVEQRIFSSSLCSIEQSRAERGKIVLPMPGFS